MSTTPHFKPPTPGGEPWEPRSIRGLCFAAAVTFSSKSPFRHDDWGREIERPYQLVVMPSYVPPKITPEIERDGDFAWYDRPITKPTIIWDAFSEMALFEMVAEVFRSDPVAGHFRVRNVAIKKLTIDTRDPDLLSTRPKREGLLPDGVVDPYGYMNAQRTHRAALQRWAFNNMAIEKERGRNTHASEWRSVSDLYLHMINKEAAPQVDNNARKNWSEKKWREAPHKPLIQDSGYKSPVSFMEERIQQAVMAKFDGGGANISREDARSQSFSGPKPQPAPPSAEDRTGTKAPSSNGRFWSRLFGH